MVSANDCVWGREFFDTYFRHAKRRSYNNGILHQAASLALIGQSIRNVRLRTDQSYIDCRIHPFIIQSSGTGKNSAFNFMSTVANAAKMSFDEHGKDSTAGIMGTVKRNGESEKGDLAGSGFVAWKEAQQLVKASQADHSSDLLEVINQALDPSGHVTRALSGGKLEYDSRTSLFATTYPPDPDNHVDLIHQGFLPRTFFVYRRWDDEQYETINEMRDDNLPRPGDSNKTYIKQHEEDVEKLSNTLKYIEDTTWNYGEVLRGDESHLAQGDEHIRYFEGVEEGVSINPTPVLNNIIDEYPYKVRKIARPFKTRLFDTTYKISACLAAVDKDEANDVYVCREIKERHVRQAKKLVKKSWRYILEFIEDYMVNVADSKILQTEKAIQEICMNDSGLATVREVMAETGQSKQQVQSDVATLQEMGKVQPMGSVAHALEPDDFVTIEEETQIWRGGNTENAN